MSRLDGTLKSNKIQHERALKLWTSRKQEIIYYYQDCQLKQWEIGNIYHVSQAIIGRWMEKLNIPSRGYSKPGKLNGRFKDGKQSRMYRILIKKEKCNNCGAIKNLCIHHKNNDHYDNRLENLEVLCKHCHISITKKAWWDAKKNGLPLPRSNAPIGWYSKKKYPPLSRNPV